MTNRIKELRERAGLKQSELARRIGSTPSTISRLEDGKRRLSDEYIGRIARALGVSSGDLFEDGSGGNVTRVPTIPVQGRCSSGMWTQAGYPGPEGVVPVLPSSTLGQIAHSAWLLDDEHAEHLTPKGGYVITVPFASIRKNAVQGDHVVVRFTEGKMERFAVGRVVSDPRGPAVESAGELHTFDNTAPFVGVVVATYNELKLK